MKHFAILFVTLAGALVLGAGTSAPERQRGQVSPAPGASAAAPSAASAALQRGITLMDTRGDCRGAIGQFAIAARSNDPAVAARALLLQGMCEERLARPDAARTTYERLLREHPGAGSVVEARKRLARLPVPSNGDAYRHVAVRRLPVPSQVPSGSISRDGRFLAYHDDRGGSWRLSLADGKAERLEFGPAPVDDAQAAPLLLSPDGQRVAYMWAQRGGVELRVKGLADGLIATLLSGDEVRPRWPVAWTADGRRLFALSTDDAYRVRLIAIDVASTAITHLADFGIFQPYRVSVSADGRYVAYDAPTAGAARDVFVLDTTTGRPEVVVRHAGNDMLPEFLPDGSGVLFTSDRLGAASLWVQPLANGRARGEAKLVRRGIGRFWPLGVGTTGVLAHAVQTSAPDVHHARATASGRFDAQGPLVTTQVVGANGGPDWSPDGQSLAYVSVRGAMRTGPGSDVLVVRNRTTGLERLLQPDLVFFGGPRWAPDGRRLLVRGHGTNDTYGFFIVDARTGAAQQVLAMEDVQRESDLGAYQWVPGREAIVYGLKGVGIRELDLATGNSRTIVPLVAGIQVTAGRGVAYDAAAQRLAWTTVKGSPGAWEYALFVREADGRVRELLGASPPDDLRLMGWMPDGRSLLVLRSFERRDGPQGRTELWTVPVDGSEPVFTGLAAPGLRNTVVAPDGKELAYVHGSSTWETWVMEGIK